MDLNHRFRTVTIFGTLLCIVVFFVSLLNVGQGYFDNDYITWVVTIFSTLGFFGPAILLVTAINQWSFGKPFRTRWAAIIGCFLMSWVWYGVATAMIELRAAAPADQHWSAVWSSITSPDLVMMTMIVTPIVFWLSGWMLLMTRRRHQANSVTTKTGIS